ncbi:MAG TPA: tyrosine-type recombinase/integrase [bacterium]|nr:tyrosine-type recombinase/integrase [bacterium]
MGSNPIARSNPHPERVFETLPPLEGPSKADAHLHAAIEAFLLNRRVGNCSARTLQTYAYNLQRFAQATGVVGLLEVTPLIVQRYLTGVRERAKPITAHQHFRTLKTFFKWCVETGLLSDHPMRGLTMKAPKMLPTVPEDDHVRRLLAACPDTFEGWRNRALVALLADSGLRISEALRLRIEDVNFATRTLMVRGGKGGKDGVGFFGAETTQYLRAWLARRRDAHPEDFLFCNRNGRPLTQSRGTHILHRLSAKAGLSRKVGPHALRHHAATSILRQTGDLELVRQVLRHESLTMALRYAHLTKPDVSAKFRRASPLDNLRAGR